MLSQLHPDREAEEAKTAEHEVGAVASPTPKEEAADGKVEEGGVASPTPKEEAADGKVENGDTEDGKEGSS